MKGIVTKPQFDRDIFKPGLPIRITCRNPNDYKLKSCVTDCLVIACSPLTLKASFVAKNSSLETASIDINDIEYYKIQFLVPEE